MRVAVRLVVSGAFSAGLGLAGAGMSGASAPPSGPPTTAAGAAPTAPATTVPVTTAAPLTVPATVHDAACVVAVQPGESISLISDQTGVEIGVLQTENGFGDDHVLKPGELLDVCAGNEINDLDGSSRELPAAPAADAFNPDCVHIVGDGESVSLISDRTGAGIGAIVAENSLGDDFILRPGELLDVCPGNDVDDVSGASRLRPPTTLLPDNDRDAIRAQQEKLNQLFAGLGMNELEVDGRSGQLTRQQLCVARAFLGVPISRSDMAAGSEEEAELLALAALPIPPVAPSDAEHWVLADMTCQVLIAGNGTSGIQFVFPISTGSEGFETRSVGRVRAFRFDPALANGGWHDSSEFPVAYDNPLNGNMYKPVYFSNGQAIHGANNVPLSPASKGCVRLTVEHQDQFLAWLGLDTATDVVWAESTINLRVTTQGAYIPDP